MKTDFMFILFITLYAIFAYLHGTIDLRMWSEELLNIYLGICVTLIILWCATPMIEAEDERRKG